MIGGGWTSGYEQRNLDWTGTTLIRTFRRDIGCPGYVFL
jgi:hypothetical protein